MNYFLILIFALYIYIYIYIYIICHALTSLTAGAGWHIAILFTWPMFDNLNLFRSVATFRNHFRSFVECKLFIAWLSLWGVFLLNRGCSVSLHQPVRCRPFQDQPIDWKFPFVSFELPYIFWKFRFVGVFWVLKGFLMVSIAYNLF